MKQIFIAIKKGKHFHLTHIFANRPETFSETRLLDKELWDPAGYTAKTDTFLNKNRRKAIFNWAAKGLFFLRGGGGYTHSWAYYKTLPPPTCDRISCETET